MAVPRSDDARLFYRCGLLRIVEARVLLKATYCNGAVYLAGYGVECMLKALVLENAPAGRRKAVFESFKGTKAHNFEWLKSLYYSTGCPDFPVEVQRAFVKVNSWSTNDRYNASVVRPTAAGKFIAAAESIMKHIDRRL